MKHIVENKPIFEAFRAKYPDFSYDSYSWSQNGPTLTLTFTYSFSKEETITTSMDVILPEAVAHEVVARHEDYIFRIGLMEALSYWKAYCSPNFYIKCGGLTPLEISWWQNVWYDGMGEFRYRNGLLSVSKNDWVKIIPSGIAGKEKRGDTEFQTLEGNLIAFTGGKDSTLTLGLFKDNPQKNNEVFVIHKPLPNVEKIRKTFGVSDWKETIVIRNMAKELILKNNNGALNGHTPFSIVIAFLGLFTASLRGKEYLLVSNEASADESTVPGTDINHQYSKSFIFEKSFQEYANMIWPDGPKYVSILRPLSEVGIISLLTQYESVMPYISSCNKSSADIKWCGKCPKCLFSFLIFSAVWDIPFATQTIGVNMFASVENMDTLLELAGLAETKPFECVGTTGECLAALSVIYTKQGSHEEPLLKEFWNSHNEILPSPDDFQKLVCAWHDHALPPELSDIIKKAQEGIYR